MLIGALAVSALIAAACGGGGDGDSVAPALVAGAPVADAQAQARTEQAVAQSGPSDPAPRQPGGATDTDAANASDSADSGDPGGRGVIAGLDTSIRSVELEQIVFDLFSRPGVSLAKIDEATILAFVDAFPPLDANRALLDESVAERVGEVHYTSAAAAAYLPDDRLVPGYVADDGQAYAFPIGILNFHELVSDTLGGRAVLISYCPLCRSGVVYERVLDGEVLTFGNTNALFQNDLVMFDRQTTSYWFQTGGEAVVGPLTGKRLPVLPSTLLPWGAWRAEHPDTLVLSMDTGFNRDCQVDPFDGYESVINAGRFSFPVDDEVANDDRLPLDELVLGLEVGDAARAYPLDTLGDAAVNDEIEGQPVVVFSSANGPTGNAFDPRLDAALAEGERLTFRFADGAYTDEQTGSLWSLGGRATAGPLAGAQLTPLPVRTTFWFSYRSAFPNVVVFEAGGS